MVRNPHRPDYILAGTVAVLLVLGVLIMASASATRSQLRFDTPFYYLSHQIYFGILPGIILAFLAFKINLTFLKKWAPLLLLINLILLGLVFFPKIGLEFQGAKRWLNLGFISFQPSEFLKLTFLLYLSAWLSAKKFKIYKSFPIGLFAFFIILSVISLFLISQPDISTLGIIVLMAILVYFLAGTPLWQSIIITIITSVSFLILIKSAPYRLARIFVFLNPELDPMAKGYQIQQALIAIGSGGIFGLGLGFGQQKFGFLPQPMEDSIFAIFAEEGGFIGSLILIFLFLTFLWRGFKIGKKSNDKFSQLFSFGITTWIVIQGFINIGSMIGIFPLTGIPLPFISYGGSHLVAELIGVGILLNISRNTS